MAYGKGSIVPVPSRLAPDDSAIRERLATLLDDLAPDVTVEEETVLGVHQTHMTVYSEDEGRDIHDPRLASSHREEATHTTGATPKAMSNMKLAGPRQTRSRQDRSTARALTSAKWDLCLLAQ